ncbi:LysR family transcriptional regulator [Streptomyces alboflavus]|uniref:LysR family transcriptional regulator n=1 Tax=Streptomyces alboflavus TaxID=67267 RepID=UPI0004C1F1F0|nr:LysR family transcriptional regulator [Streptomyces alboflavus]
MKFSQLAAFVAIADHGSFTKAADSLGVTQSAVSHAIAGLEAELRVGVMRRDRSGVDLTEAGSRILEHARSVLASTERIKLEASAAHTTAEGRLLIGISQSFSLELLPRLIADFRARHPSLEIGLREGNDRRIAEMLYEHTIDVGIVTLPKYNLTTYPLLRDEMCVVVPGHHHLASVARLPVWRLAEEDLIIPADGVEPTLRLLFQAAGARLRVAHRIQDLHVVLSMVAEGLGVTVLPSLAIPSSRQDLVAVPFEPAVRRHIAIGVSAEPDERSLTMEFIRSAQALARTCPVRHRLPSLS